MNKEPMETTILPEIKRRKRKVSSDYAGYDLMYYDVTQELINNYYLHLQKSHKATKINS